MFVTFKIVKAMLEEAYDSARSSSYDLKSQMLEEIAAAVQKPPEFRVYPVEELSALPVGAKFCHSLLGNGEIIQKKGVRAPFMKFESGLTNAFVTNAFPWNLPMVQLEGE